MPGFKRPEKALQMSCDFAIKITDVSKCYQIYDKPIDRLRQMLSRGRKQYFREFWALKNINCEIGKGKTVGIIGRNGAGKSTLLQLICGTQTQTNGEIYVSGRVAALLELGAGFNNEFSGKENIFLNAELYGLKKKEIEQKYEEIISFSEIGPFINQPVKTYSSGMYVRLAFAIASSINPDIFIIDEALSVGDLAFQAKCMKRIKALKDSGTTILFVSHDLSSVRNICDEVIWLQDGTIQDYGKPKEVVDGYIRKMNLAINDVFSSHDVKETSVDKDVSYAGSSALKLNPEKTDISSLPSSFGDSSKRYGNGKATIIDVTLLNSSEQSTENLVLHESFKIKIKFEVNSYIQKPAIGYMFRDLKGNSVVGMMSSGMKKDLPSFIAGDIYEVLIVGKNALSSGSYSLLVAIENIAHKNHLHEFVDVIEDAIFFKSHFGSAPEDIFPSMVWQKIDLELIKS